MFQPSPARNYNKLGIYLWDGIAQSVQRLATGRTIRESNPGGGEIFRTCPDRSWSPPTLLYNGYRVFPGGKARSGRDADPSPLLVPWSWKGRAIPLLPLWAVGLYRASAPVQGCTLPFLTSIFFLYVIVIYTCRWPKHVVVDECIRFKVFFHSDN